MASVGQLSNRGRVLFRSFRGSVRNYTQWRGAKQLPKDSGKCAVLVAGGLVAFSIVNYTNSKPHQALNVKKIKVSRRWATDGIELSRSGLAVRCKQSECVKCKRPERDSQLIASVTYFGAFCELESFGFVYENDLNLFGVIHLLEKKISHCSERMNAKLK